MTIRIGLCSDIDLEFKFKHMTSKKAIIYENHQLEDFEALISKIVESKVDVILIAGNLFANMAPEGFERFPNHYFVETGTYVGQGIRFALRANFSEIHSLALVTWSRRS